MRRTNGWTPERRARQAELIRQWQPWTRATGPKTEIGKAISSRNATQHGRYTAVAYAERSALRQWIRQCGSRLLGADDWCRLDDRRQFGGW
ncbi:hypothetical protein EGI20_14485 [Aquitalea sp. S1-19]|nr:hypothetical protein [Aquitalea sp. S1-19]